MYCKGARSIINIHPAAAEDRLSWYGQLLTVEIWQSLSCPANVLKPWAAFQVLIMCVICQFLCLCMYVECVFPSALACLTNDPHACECMLRALRGWHMCGHAPIVHGRRWACTQAFAPVCACAGMCALAGMSADVPSNPAVGLFWISSRLQGMGIPFPFTALPGSKQARMPSLYCLHTGWSLKVCLCVVVVSVMCIRTWHLSGCMYHIYYLMCIICMVMLLKVLLSISPILKCLYFFSGRSNNWLKLRHIFRIKRQRFIDDKSFWLP